jgi:hypothetical protein
MKRVSLFICGALLLGGCETSAPPIQMPSSTPGGIQVANAMGRPQGLSSGAHMGYWVWKDQDAVWHVRTTSARVRHHFEGKIHPFPGTAIFNLQAISHERDDRLDMVGGDISFMFRPRENIDGIDFQLTGPDALELDLRIDDDGDPTHIFIGERQRQPANSHFIISP